MAIYNTSTITIGTNATVTVADYTAFGLNFRGYNEVVPAGSVNPTTFNSRPIRFVQWASNNTLGIAFGSNGGNTGWTTVVVNNTSFSRSAATYSAWDGTQEGWTWSGVSTNPFPTVGTFKLDFVGNNDTEYGFNAASFGSMTNTTYRDFGIQLVFHKPSTDTLSLGLTNALVGGVPINGKWGYINIGGTKYYRTDAQTPFALFGVAIFNWAGITANPFGNTASGTRSFTMGYEDPDTVVSVVVPENIGAGDTRFGVTVNGIDSPYTGRLYGVALDPNDTSEILATTVPFVTTTSASGPSVSFDVIETSETDNLPSLGQTRTYYLYAARTGDTGGAGGPNNEGEAAWIYAGDTFTVTRTNTPSTLPSEDPVLEPYGLAINDDAGNLLTSFSTEVMLNRVFSADTILSSTTNTTITGVPTSATEDNSLITVDLAIVADTSTPPPPALITSPGTITVAVSQDNFQGARVSVLQYRDIPATGYGLIVKNGLDEGIINENTVAYGVSEFHIIDPTLTTLTPNVIPGTEQSRNTTITLTGTYPINKTAPVVAINSTHGDWIIKPFLYSSDSINYDKLFIFLPTTFTADTEWKIAILVPSDVVTPEKYGTSNDYGLDIKDSSGNTTWSSSWKQGIISHVQNANVFTTGLNQNGTYDIDTGYDGVTIPALATSDIYVQLISTGEIVEDLPTRRLDPANTFISFSSCQGRIQYNGGVKTLDGVFQYNAGGGTHYPAARIESSTAISLQMFRVADFNPASTTDRLRMPRSHHPYGFIMFMRILGIEEPI